MMELYILEEKEPVLIKDRLLWARFFENTESRIVAYTTIEDIRISTVFLGTDHRFGDGPPLLFETLVFDGELDGEMDRYSTWEEAEKGHDEMVKRVKETL